MHISIRFWFALVMIACGLLATRAFAQTDVHLLIDPWLQGQAFDTSTEAVIESSGPSREDHTNDIGLSSYHAVGRWRVLPDQRATPTLGYDVLYFDVRTSDPALPRHLWDASVGFAQPVAEINKYFVVLTGAVGYAGDTPFSDPHAQYFTANLIVGREFSKDRALVVAFNYDGNRTFLPDAPIPGLAYTDRLNEHLTYVIGAPVNSISYRPITGLQVDVGWELLETFSGRVGYEFGHHFEIFANYVDRLTPFHLSNLPADRRLFLQEHRFEAGLKWNPTRLINLYAGGGWAFGQEFSTGFDDRGLNPLRHLRDGPFFEVNLTVGF